MRPELIHDLLDAAPVQAPATAQRDRTLRYGEIAAASERIALWMRCRGIEAGDRVLISLSRSRALDVAAFLYACSRLGAVFCVLHEQVTGAAFGYVLEDAGPALVVSDDLEILAAAAGQSVPTCHPDTDFGSAPAARQPRRVTADAPACMIYTSGSTARPKAVVSTHAQMIFVTQAIQSQLRYQPDDVIYTTQPFSFDVGLYQLFLAALCGAQVWLPSQSGAGVLIVAELLASEATVFPAVPAVAQTLAWMLGKSREAVPVPRLRLLTNTGAAMPDGVLAVLRSRLPDLRIQLMYGLTECKRVTIMPVDGDLDRPGSSGLALPGTQVRIIDGAGRTVPAGVVGEIVVTGPHVMNGYWNQPVLTEEKFQQSGLRTGDFGYVDEDGYLYVDGRRDDIYKQNGFRVSATEVEAAALRLPGVRMAALLPPKNGRDSILVVSGSLDAGRLKRELGSQLEVFKLPKRFLVLEDLPLNQNGKVDKSALASRFPAREPAIS